MAENNLTHTQEVKKKAERKLTFHEKLRINWPFIPAVIFVISGIRMFTLTTGTQLLFTDSNRGSAYKYFWIWLLLGVLFAAGGALARPVMKKLTETASAAEPVSASETAPAAEPVPVNTESGAEMPAQEASAESAEGTISDAAVPVEETIPM